MEALSFAVEKGLHKLAEALLAKGTTGSVDENGSTLLHRACETLDEDMVKILVRAGYNVNAPTKQGITPIMILAQHEPTYLMRDQNQNPLRIAKYLIENNPEIVLDTVGPEGLLPYQMAERAGNLELADLLAENLPYEVQGFFY